MQKGLNLELELKFIDENKGFGVLAMKNSEIIKKNTFICEYIGEIIDENLVKSRKNTSYLLNVTEFKENLDEYFLIKSL